MSQAASAWSLRVALQPGIAAVRRFWPPFVLIQLAAAGLVVAYYQVEGVRTFADSIGKLKTEWGLLFSALGGFVAGGIVPEIAKAATRRMAHPDAKWLGNTLFNGFVYLIVASQVDLFYRFQAWLFGPGIDPGTIALKTAVDMGLFAPFLCMPTAVLICSLRENSWRIGPTLRGVHRVWFLERVVPAILPGWAFWIPFLLALYALPLPIQMPLALLGEAAWSIIFIFIATQELE